MLLLLLIGTMSRRAFSTTGITADLESFCCDDLALELSMSAQNLNDVMSLWM